MKALPSARSAPPILAFPRQGGRRKMPSSSRRRKFVGKDQLASRGGEKSSVHQDKLDGPRMYYMYYLSQDILPCTARHTFSALRGASRCRALVPDIASKAALVMATAQATVGSSPMPFRRSGFVGDGVSRVAVRISSISLACGSG